MKKHHIILIIVFIITLTFFVSCKPENNIEELNYSDLLQENYIGIIITTLGVLIGAIIGGLITLGVNLKIQNRERVIIYAQKNREEIYEPLYNQNKKNLYYLSSNEFITIHLRTWNDLEESKKIRAPKELKKIIEQFENNEIKYMSALNKAEIDLLPVLIKQEIKEIMIENKIIPQINENIYLTKTTELINKKIKSDLLAGKILKKESIIRAKLMGEITFKDFFERFNAKISKREEFISLREEIVKMTEIVIKLDRYLKNKIEYISKKYEGKLTKI